MLTLEQIEKWRAAFNEGYGWGDMGGVEARKQTNALCDLAKLALTPPQDVAELVEELRAYCPDDGNHWKAPNVCTQAADAILSLSARNRGLEAENEKLRKGGNMAERASLLMRSAGGV